MSIKSILFTGMVLAMYSGSLAQTKDSMKPINQNAPVKCSKTITIQASPEKIWQVLTDIDRWNQWQKSVNHSRLNGPLKANTTFDWKADGLKIHSCLHTVTPYKEFGWTGKVYGIHAVHNWTFRSINGATEVSVSESMEGFLTKLFKKSFNKTLEKGMEKSLEELKAACES